MFALLCMLLLVREVGTCETTAFLLVLKVSRLVVVICVYDCEFVCIRV